MDEKSSEENPHLQRRRENLHINSFLLVTKEHKSSTKFSSLQKLWTRRKQIHTKLNPFVWFKSFAPFFHLVHSTKGLDALKPRHTKDSNDFGMEGKRRRKL
jgi:hypothetical protein